MTYCIYHELEYSQEDWPQECPFCEFGMPTRLSEGFFAGDAVPAHYLFRVAGSQPTAWQWCLGGDWHTVVFSQTAAPHWLGRYLQRVFLGIHWRRCQ